MLGAQVLVVSLALLPTQETAGGDSDEFFDLSLEQLMAIDVEVTSVTRSTQRVVESAAAIYVLTHEDIRRSGATSIMEVLRFVPGLHVARLNNSNWAIGSRGFNDQFADKLLVLIDGRSVYTPLFSGMFWDVQDYPLEDIERIEVIRGPGAAVWGANAVNGVINVITKSAHDTQGGSLGIGTGRHERGFGHVRFGGPLGDDGAYRVYGKYFRRGPLERPDGFASDDEWEQAQAGFRVDSDPDNDDTWTVQGDVFAGEAENDINVPNLAPPPPALVVKNDTDVRGGNLLGRWTRQMGDQTIALKAYLDVTQRELDFFEEDRITVDVEAVHRTRLSDRNELTWGLGYRLSDSDLEGPTPLLQFSTDGRSDPLFSAFVHDEYELSTDLTLILGTKIEHNNYTQFEIQPNARLSWRPTEATTSWLSVSRAVATPSVVDNDVSLLLNVIPGPPDTLVTLTGNDDVEAEQLIAYEAGYRTLVSDNLSLDLSLFFNDYDNLVTNEPGTPFPSGGNIILPVRLENRGEAESYGGELSTEWKIRDGWSAMAGYSYLELHTDVDSGSADTMLADDDGRAPQHQLHVRSYCDLSEELQLNLAAFYVDRLATDRVPSYIRGDVVLDWTFKPGAVLRFGAIGLFHDGEREFGNTPFLTGSEMEAAAYVQLRLQF